MKIKYKTIDEVIEETRNDCTPAELIEFDEALEEGRKWVQEQFYPEEAQMKVSTCNIGSGSDNKSPDWDV